MMKIYKASENIRNQFNRRTEPSEQFLTENFIDAVSTKTRSHAYQFTQFYEGKKSGADFLWLVITDHGVFKFLIQAKKADYPFPYISKDQALYKNGKQIKLLLNYAREFNCIPFYFLYSNRINKFKCINDTETVEGVFFETAHHFFDYFNNEKEQLNILPLSCLFACFSKKCNYFEKEIKKPCVSCKECERCRVSVKVNDNITCIYDDFDPKNLCPHPFELFLKFHYNIDYTPVNINSYLLLSIFGDSIFAHNPSLVPFLLEDLDYPKEFIGRIIISDYLNRHSQHYLNSLLGNEVHYNQEVLTLDFIINIIRKHWKECRLFSQIGIFGSYSRGEAKADSDVDICLKYDFDKIKSKNHLQKLVAFLTNVIKDLKKNVDFIDFMGYSGNHNFIDNIEKDMIWIGKPY